MKARNQIELSEAVSTNKILFSLNEKIYRYSGIWILTEDELYPKDYLIERVNLVPNKYLLNGKEIAQINKIIYKHR